MLTFTAVPRTETSLSVKTPEDIKMPPFFYIIVKIQLWQEIILKKNDFVMYQCKLLLSSSEQSWFQDSYEDGYLLLHQAPACQSPF